MRPTTCEYLSLDGLNKLLSITEERGSKAPSLSFNIRPMPTIKKKKIRKKKTSTKK